MRSKSSKIFDRHPRAGQWIMAGVILFLLLVLQTTPGFLSFGTFKVTLILPFAIGMATVSDEVSAGIFGAVTGVLWDMVSGRLVGFGGLLLLGLCFFTSLLFSGYLRSTHRFCGAVCMIAFVIHGLLDYVFYYLTVSPSGFLRYLLVHIGIGGVVAGLLGFVLFGLCKRLDAWGSRPPRI